MPIVNISQHRKAVGVYNNKPRKPSDKSIRKAIRKAHRSHETISTRRNIANTSTSNPSTSPVRALFMLALAASVIGSTNAMTGGQIRESNPIVRATFPYLGTRASLSSYCSSVRLNDRQLLTAKHCVNDKPWSWTKSKKGWDFASEKLEYPHDNLDLAILTFDTDLRGEARCVPIMSKETRVSLPSSPKNACGLNARIVEFGNGISEREKCLHSGLYEIHSGVMNKPKDFSAYGLKVNGKFTKTQNGDSGGGLVGCNAKTGKYELMGIFHSRSGWDDEQPSLSWFVDIAAHDEIRNWIIENTKNYTCTGDSIKNEELYDYNQNDNDFTGACNQMPFSSFVSFFASDGAGIVSFIALASIAAKLFYKKRTLNFHAVSVQSSANENNNENIEPQRALKRTKKVMRRENRQKK